MFCINCNSKTKVTNSRSSKVSASKWRRRQCLDCDYVFSTSEKPNFSLSVKIRDKSGKYKAFSDDKLFLSIYECISHKKNAARIARSLSDTVCLNILPIDQYETLDAEIIFKKTYQVLSRLDKISANQYKSIHR